jgi:hypothetical protein
MRIVLGLEARRADAVEDEIRCPYVLNPLPSSRRDQDYVPLRDELGRPVVQLDSSVARGDDVTFVHGERVPSGVNAGLYSSPRDGNVGIHRIIPRFDDVATLLRILL